MKFAPPSCTAFTLATLPIELIEAIALSLERHDLLRLRLACRQLCQKTLHPFGKLFETLQTDLSSSSLQKLEFISEIKQTEHDVQTLVIAKGNNGRFGQEFRWYQTPSSHAESSFPNFERLQNILLHKFPHCRSFRIKNHDASEDETLDFLRSDAIAMILYLITRSYLHVKCFMIDVGHSDLDATRLQIWQTRQSSFPSAWKHLRELSLYFGLTSDTFDWAFDLIVHACNLQSLSLSLYFNESEAFFIRLGASKACRGLTSLTLTSMHVASSNHLVRLISRSKDTLQSLCIWHIVINEGDTWPIVLEQWRTQLVRLERFSLNWLTDYIRQYGNGTIYHFPSLLENSIIPESGGRKFTLRIRKRKNGPKLLGVDYDGPSVDKAIEMLVNAAEYL